MKRFLVVLMLVLLGMCFVTIAQASISDGRIVANIDKIETYGSTLHIVGWVYDANNPSAAVTLHVDNSTAYVANQSKGSSNSTCPVSGNHYFDIAHPWTTKGERVMIHALYTDGTGACGIYDNVAYFINIYTVTYNANGGSGAPAADYKHENISLRLSGTKPKRTGYTFSGWGTSASGTAKYQPNGSYTANASATLYAVWKRNTYTLSYDANGGEGAPAAQSGLYNTTIVLSSTIPSREGYNFCGWATSSTGSVAYKPGDAYVLDANRTLYAVWQLKTYAVNYDANGGTGAPEAQVKSHGIDLTLSDVVPTREEYVFLGWAEDYAATEPTWQPADVYTANAPLTLYAVWKEARIPGDVNGDKEVNTADAQLLLQYLADLPVEIVARNADVTGDDLINGKDALRLLKFLAGADVVLQ